MLTKILDYLRYPSTWQGAITLLALVGVTFSPEQGQAIVTAAVGVVGAIMVFFSDTDVKPKE
jgi:hypothetical protein